MGACAQEGELALACGGLSGPKRFDHVADRRVDLGEQQHDRCDRRADEDRCLDDVRPDHAGDAADESIEDRKSVV